MDHQLSYSHCQAACLILNLHAPCCCAGVGATLARDVPFSAAYWGLLEPLRKSMLPSDGSHASPSHIISANMAAGAIAGGAASALTQPLVNFFQDTFPALLSLLPFITCDNNICSWADTNACWSQ